MYSLTFRVRNPCPDCDPPNSAQLGCIPHHSSNLHLGPCNSVGMRLRTDTQTERQTGTQTPVTAIHFPSSTTHAKCNNGRRYFFITNWTPLDFAKSADDADELFYIFLFHKVGKFHTKQSWNTFCRKRRTEMQSRRTPPLAGCAFAVFWWNCRRRIGWWSSRERRRSAMDRHWHESSRDRRAKSHQRKMRRTRGGGVLALSNSVSAQLVTSVTQRRPESRAGFAREIQTDLWTDAHDLWARLHRMHSIARMDPFYSSHAPQNVSHWFPFYLLYLLHCLRLWYSHICAEKGR